MTAVQTTLDKLGRIVIPAEQRRELGLKPGDRLHVTIVDGEIRLLTTRAIVRRVQAALRPYRPKGGKLRSEELSDERSQEAARE